MAKSDFLHSLGVLMSIWTDLVAAVRERDGTDDDLYRLATPEGKSTVAKIAKVIMPKEPPKSTGENIILLPGGLDVLDLGEIETDYDKPIEPLLVRAHKLYEKEQIRHLSERRGRVTSRLYLCATGRYVKNNGEMEAMFETQGLMPGDAAQYYAAIQKHESLKWRVVVALASTVHKRDGLIQPFKSRDDHAREWRFDFPRDAWHPQYAYLATPRPGFNPSAYP